MNKHPQKYQPSFNMDDLEAIQKELAERSLYEFIQVMWHAVEPATEFKPGKVLEAICRHCEAVADGDITRLLINVPPGHMKSLICNVFFPAWVWGPLNRPSTRFFTASYSSDLTQRDNDRTTRVILDPLYQRFWGDRFQLTHRGVTKIQNNRTGWKLATSVGGLGTGERGDILILDDLNNVKEAESKAITDATNMWLTEVIPSRLNDPEKSAIINIQQRTNEADATGTLLGFWVNYHHLMLPMRYDPDRHCANEFFSDWRTKDGQLLWPLRFPEKAARDLERMSPYAVAGQLQQSPVPRGGGLILREWWQDWGVRDVPPSDFVLASLDTAIKDGEQNDYYAFTVWLVWRDPDSGVPKMLLFYAWRMRDTLAAVCQRVVASCKQIKIDRLVIEDKANGWAAQQAIMNLTDGAQFGISMFDPRRYGDKTARLLSVQHLFSEGLIYAPYVTDADGNYMPRLWAQEVIDEIANFPRAKHDDYVDSCSMALRYLRDTGFALTKQEYQRDERQLATHRSHSEPIYDV